MASMSAINTDLVTQVLCNGFALVLCNGFAQALYTGFVTTACRIAQGDVVTQELCSDFTTHPSILKIVVPRVNPNPLHPHQPHIRTEVFMFF